MTKPKTIVKLEPKIPFRWRQEELAILEKNADKPALRIHKIMLTHGYRRSVEGIIQERKRKGMTLTNAERYTLQGLARILQVSEPKVRGWIRDGLLKATRPGTGRTEQQGGDYYAIAPKDIRNFIVENTSKLDFCKIDKYWLVDILCYK